MDLFVAGVGSGVLATVVMDVLNRLVARTGILSRMDMGTLGRMAAGWVRGHFRYGHPQEIAPVANEGLYGVATHYTIGVSFALAYLVGWNLWVGGPASPVWALPYGVATTAASWFLVYPAMGLGVCGRRSPDGIKAPLSSLVNHVFYGVGLAMGTALLAT
jgi:hypothetical protein